MMELADTHDSTMTTVPETIFEVIDTESLRIFFQPIIDFGTNRVTILGYEALMRGPKSSPFNCATELFEAAERDDCLYDLERVGRKLALKKFKDKIDETKIFLNLDPNVIYDESFTEGFTTKCLKKFDINRRNVVFELTERNSVNDQESFEEALRHYRGQDFEIAVDDVGSGYSNLDKIARAKPHYIKIDMNLIRNLHLNRNQFHLVETIRDLADRIGSKVIAEGIENKEELRTLLSIGIDFGQGYYFAHPSLNPPRPENSNSEHIRSNAPRHDKNRKEPTIGELAKAGKTFGPTALTKDVYDYFEENPDDRSVVIQRDEVPIGLLMRKHLYKNLSTQIKQSLYWERSIRHVMDEDPLIIPADRSISKVSTLTTKRDDEFIYDHLIVVDPESGIYQGNVAIHSLLEEITQLKTRRAKQANPLTGLPGNVEIQNQVQSLLNGNKTFTLIYADLDHFKPFNDFYGFERGNKAILLLKNILRDGFNMYPDQKNFIGHVGGDDFVVTTDATKYQEFCEYVLDQFDDQVKNLYDPNDLQEGFIQTCNRRGEEKKFNLMTLSLAVVTNENRSFDNHLEMSEVAADVKKYAKENRSESNYKVDRRSD